MKYGLFEGGEYCGCHYMHTPPKKKNNVGQSFERHKRAVTDEHIKQLE